MQCVQEQSVLTGNVLFFTFEITSHSQSLCDLMKLINNTFDFNLERDLFRGGGVCAGGFL